MRIAIGVVAVGVSVWSAAQATPILELTDTSTGVTIAILDGQTGLPGGGDITPAGDGQISVVIPGTAFNGTGTSAWANFVVSFASTKPAEGDVDLPSLAFTYFGTSSGPASMQVRFSESGFTGGSPIVIDYSHSLPTGASSVQYALFGGTSNSTLDTSNLLAVAGTVCPVPTLCTGSGVTAPMSTVATGPYSLTQRLLVTSTAAGITSGSYRAIPAPSVPLLLGGGLIGFAALRRVRAAR